jgi:hypothetical protein
LIHLFQIEDLEISIQTLTKFNAELEAANKKQAAEIQELKRKLNMYVDYVFSTKKNLNLYHLMYIYFIKLFSNDSFMSIYESDDDEVSTPLSEVWFYYILPNFRKC